MPSRKRTTVFGTPRRLAASNSHMSTLQKVGVFLIAATSLGVIIQESIHFYRYGHFVLPTLHADTVVRTGDIGIEGISKLYEAKLTNYAPVPVKVTACDFISDASVSRHHGRVCRRAMESPIGQMGESC
jgi:hypothetical protein